MHPLSYCCPCPCPCPCVPSHTWQVSKYAVGSSGGSIPEHPPEVPSDFGVTPAGSGAYAGHGAADAAGLEAGLGAAGSGEEDMLGEDLEQVAEEVLRSEEAARKQGSPPAPAPLPTLRLEDLPPLSSGEQLF